MTTPTTLAERLRDLADDAPDALDGSALWAAGRRRHRSRQVGSAVIVVVAALVIGAVVGMWWQRSAPMVEPASSEAPVGIPDRFWAPSPWLPGTDDEGPPGPLVALLATERGGWTGVRPGGVGISATTQEHRFLDLPGFEGGEVALSPDGTQVAWWTAGGPSGSEAAGAEATYLGYAVYDAVTGDVRRREVSTVHGLETSTLFWADRDVLVAGYGQILAGADGPEDLQGSLGDEVVEHWPATGRRPASARRASGSTGSSRRASSRSVLPPTA